MNGEVHVMIIKVPMYKIQAAAKEQVPDDFECVDSEYSEVDDAVFFSYRRKEKGELIIGKLDRDQEPS